VGEGASGPELMRAGASLENGGIGVVLATYAQPRYLSLVLEAYARQERRPDEIIVADDGSGPETARVVEECATRLDLPLLHLWQPDRGFRKTLILNRAVRAASSDYLIFSDGDCLPRRDFVKVHGDLARSGRFLAGSAVRLGPQVSRTLGVEDVRTGRFASLRWLRGQGERPGRRALRFAPPPIGAVLDLLSPTRATWSGGNASVAREEIVRVNGFDLDLGYGGEDRIFGERLRNAGVRGVQIRHRALLVHLDHGRPYRDPEQVRRQKTLRRAIQGGGVIRASQGLEETTNAELRVRRWSRGERQR
jgi:glycosyltransferase involved in cell wall biosynthesis